MTHPPRRKPTMPSSEPSSRSHLFISRNLSLFSVALIAASFVQSTNAQSLADDLFVEKNTYAGFTSRVNQKGLDLMAEYLRQRVNKFLQYGEISYNVTLPLTPSVSLVLASQRVENYEAGNFKSQMKINPGRDLRWTGSNLRATVRTVYRIISNSGEVSGQVPITYEQISVNMSLLAGINSDGHLKTDLHKCSVHVSDLSFGFSAADYDLLRNYLPFIHRAVRENVDQLICPSFHAELIPVVSNRLLNTPMTSALFDHYFINYGLIGSVKYNADSLELHHRGNVFGILRQGRTRLNDFRLPFTPTAFTPVPDTKRMVTFQMSNHTIASLLYWMDQYRRFDYEISRNSVNDSNIAGYLRTECDSTEICAGTLFPSLKQRFSKGVVNIRSHTIGYPVVKLEKGKVKIIIDSRIDAFVQQADRNRRFMTASMLAEVSLSSLKFKDYKLTGTLIIDSFKISDVISLVNGIDEGSIEFLINALTELILADDMATKLKDGIKLPIIFDFDQAGPAEIVVEKDRLTVGLDFCFDDNCPKAAPPGSKNSNGNDDYYDSVQGTGDA